MNLRFGPLSVAIVSELRSGGSGAAPVTAGGLTFHRAQWSDLLSVGPASSPAAVIFPDSLPTWAMNPVIIWCESHTIPYLLVSGPVEPESNFVGPIWRSLVEDSRVKKSTEPLVTVFTPSNGPETFILRAYRSLREQTYKNWEWVVLANGVANDSDTSRVCEEIARNDGRVHFVSTNRANGVIGALKRQAALLGSGSILAELDHDDELSQDALRHLVNGFSAHEDCGMAYTDWTELLDGVARRWYGRTFGFGYGYYSEQNVDGKNLLVAVQPEINSHTVRHIVGMPNHLRAWRSDFYWDIGGHNGLLAVADDFDICVRSFLATRMLHIQHCSYLQHFRSTGTNTQITRNEAIQTAVASIAETYEASIRSRLSDLGLFDHIYTEPADISASRETKANLEYRPRT